MMRTTTARLRTAMLLAGALVALTATGGAAHPSALPTEILDLHADTAGTEIAVGGEVIFGGEDPVLVGEDPAGDNLGGSHAAASGTDITGLEISQPDAATPELRFTIELADAPETGGIPEAVQFNWDVAVDGGADAGGSNWSIKAMRTQVRATQTTSPYAAVFDCQPSGTGFSCSEVERLVAEFEAEEAAIHITVPFSAIGAEPGSTIDAWGRNGDPVWARTSAAGILTGLVTLDGAFHDPYTVPQPGSVMLGVAPAGTEASHDTVAELHTHTHEGEPGVHGHFHGSLTVPEAGDYDVGARGCFAGGCDEKTLTVTVTG